MREYKEKIRKKNKSSPKKTSTRKKKRKKNLPENANSEVLPAHLKYIPDNIKHLTEKDNIILKIVADGACAPRAGAAHVYEYEYEYIFQQISKEYYDKYYKL